MTLQELTSTKSKNEIEFLVNKYLDTIQTLLEKKINLPNGKNLRDLWYYKSEINKSSFEIRFKSTDDILTKVLIKQAVTLCLYHSACKDEFSFPDLEADIIFS